MEKNPPQPRIKIARLIDVDVLFGDLLISTALIFLNSVNATIYSSIKVPLRRR